MTKISVPTRQAGAGPLDCIQGRLAPARPESTRRRPWRPIVSLALILAVACGGGCGGKSSPSLSSAATVVDDFLADLEVGAWHAAYGRLHPQLQAECTSAERLRALIEAAGAQPVSWTLRPPGGRKRSALVSGSYEKQDGTSGIVEFTLEAATADAEAGWQILFWSVDNRELCLDTP